MKRPAITLLCCLACVLALGGVPNCAWGGKEVQEEIWELSALSSGRGIIPARHALTVRASPKSKQLNDREISVEIRPINYSFFREFLFSVGCMLKLTSTFSSIQQLSQSDTSLCPLPPELEKANFFGTWKGFDPSLSVMDGIYHHLCSGPFLPLSFPLSNGVANYSDSPKEVEIPTSYSSLQSLIEYPDSTNATCIALPWKVVQVHTFRLSSSHAVVFIDFLQSDGKRCHVGIEGIRQELFTDSPSGASIFSTVLLLALLWVLRSKIFAKKMKSMLIGENKQRTLSTIISDKNKQLLKQRDELIERMMREDGLTTKKTD